MADSKQSVDMLNGGLAKKLLVFALPLAASSILQQLFNSVDVAVVGKFDTSTGQAAVGCNAPVINLLINLFGGLSIGANVVISTYIGQGKKEKAKDTVHTAMAISMISGVLLLFLGMIFARPVLEWMDTPTDILNQAVIYLKIYFIGMPFVMVYNFGAAILRCVGDTKKPLYALIVSGVVNTILNLFLVIGFHLGVVGVAIATVVSNVISSTFVLICLTKADEIIRLNLKEIAVKTSELSKIMKVGLPAGIQTSVFSIANIFIQAALNGYGSDAVAGSSVTLNYEIYEYYMVTAFGQAAVTFVSQNYGANKYKRCRKIFYECIGMAIFAVIIMSTTFVTGRSFFIGLFTSKPEVAHYAEIRMFYLLIPYILITTYEISGAALRGIGYSMTPAIITMIGTCVLRLTWIYTVCRRVREFRMLMIVYPISWIVTGSICLIVYFILSGRLTEKESV